MTMIAENLQRVHQQIARACAACAREPGQVTLLAVSKTQDEHAIRAAYAAGQRAFGENYVLEAVGKMRVLSDLAIEWHCIGPVQSNKTRLVAEHFDWVHSVDQLKTAQRLSQQRAAHLAPLQVCLQVNVDGGANKSGVAPQDALTLALAVRDLPGLRLRGIMSLPEPTTDFVASKEVHTRARALFDQMNQAGVALDTLSLGMSADLDAAIQAGSTVVRVGSAIFGARPPAAARKT